MQIELLRSTEILHRADSQGPRLVRIDYIRVDDEVVAVDFWHNSNGTIHHIAAPRPLRSEELSCSWLVRRAEGDRGTFEPCGRPGEFCTSGPAWQRGFVRCKRHVKS